MVRPCYKLNGNQMSSKVHGYRVLLQTTVPIFDVPPMVNEVGNESNMKATVCKGNYTVHLTVY